MTNELAHPVERVSWIDATNYCALLSQREQGAGRLPIGWEYRLPTEAQWEYGCRAGTRTAFAYGPALRSGMANFRNLNGTYLGRTAEVGSYLPNAWGLYDMHGNVWEWCMDWYGGYSGGSVTDPTGPVTGSYRVPRSGGYGSYPSSCRSASRDKVDEDDLERDSNLGFRVALVSVP